LDTSESGPSIQSLCRRNVWVNAMKILPRVEWAQTNHAVGHLKESDLNQLLYHWYWKDRITLNQIARELHVSVSTVQRMFVLLRIPRRPQGNKRPETNSIIAKE
jgi:AraC-like DNA-binding protein